MPESPFPSLSEELVARLAQSGDAIEFERGARVITEGEASDALFVLVSGRLKVFTQDGRGRELIYNEMVPGEFFGEMFIDGGSRSASVAAMENSRCVRVDRSQFRDFMATYPEFAESLALTLIQRLRQATDLIKGLALHDVQERTVRLLEQTAVPEEGGIRALPKSLTQQQIANRIGATREMVNHIVRRFIGLGYMAKQDGRLVLLRDLPHSEP